MVQITDTAEWVRMYRSGITSSEIADVCDVDDILEVLRSLADAKRADATLEKEHSANLMVRAHQVAERVSAKRTLTPSWVARLNELSAFVQSHGVMPRQRGGDETETSLGRWLHAQRGKVGKGTLDPRQRAALDAVGDWDSDRRAEREAKRFPAQLIALAQFRARHKRWPTYMNRTDDQERALGVWLHTLRQAARDGRLPAQVREVLDRQVPGWNP
jgi:hypothetical protein